MGRSLPILLDGCVVVAYLYSVPSGRYPKNHAADLRIPGELELHKTSALMRTVGGRYRCTIERQTRVNFGLRR